MGIWAHQLFLLPLLIALAFAATDDLGLLINPDFESPPSNSSTISFLPLNSSINSIPGWSFQGFVAYVTSSGGGLNGISLPGGNGSHIYLGVDGKINQTIKTSSDEEPMHYVLTFILAAVDQKNCARDGLRTGVTISVTDKSCSVSFEQKFGKEMWQYHACYLVSYGDGELLNLSIENQSNNNITAHDSKNSTTTSRCGPILDMLVLKKIENPITEDNLLVNGGFELGPYTPDDSTTGVIMEEAPSPAQSPLIQWAIIGTVKYITPTENYPAIIQEGNAAIEILSRGNSPSGIQTEVTLKKGSTYRLNFTIIGYATDGCVGGFRIGVQAGSEVENITMPSGLEGDSLRVYSIPFKADSIVIPISFLSFKTTKTIDSVYCGPVIDKVVLYASYGLKLELSFMVLFSCLVFLVTIL